jgi:SAM-dependent methyltransferase
VHAFGPLCTLFYDADHPLATEAETGWYRERLPQDAGSALDLMCGSGRLLVPMVAAGAKIHGVDHSAPMLGSCEARLAAAHLAAPLYRQDVTQMNLPFRFVAAYASTGAFQLITDPMAASAALQRIRAHLIDPGVLLLPMFVPAESVQRLGAPLVEVRTAKLADGTRIALRSETTVWADARLSRTEARYAHRRGAQRLAEEHETLTMTWYPPDEIAAIVRAAGFRDVRIDTAPRARNDEDAFAVIGRL